MDNLTAAALEEAVKWGVPCVMAGLLAWVGVKRQKLLAWNRRRIARRRAVTAMAHTWPTQVKAIADAVSRDNNMTERFDSLNELIGALSQRLDGMSESLAGLLAIKAGQFELEAEAMFVCDANGCNTMVNTAYARAVGVGRDDLMGFGYKRFIAPADLDDYWPRFKAASDDQHELDAPLWITRPNGERVRARVRMIPHPRKTGPATHWVGLLMMERP